ncbi:hypothetical protein CVV38_04150 [Candidatus Peregrinibacteria bacterium HGW-Peregrinibacteria-1]|jgi:hypothetical protein|nr:MAG: hypothetical protein CVV38_04150 [Candidatus Peregrinibacteria bacterium HGW-Peregrinibacteria-1]
MSSKFGSRAVDSYSGEEVVVNDEASLVEGSPSVRMVYSNARGKFVETTQDEVRELARQLGADWDIILSGDLN